MAAWLRVVAFVTLGGSMSGLLEGAGDLVSRF